MPSPDPAAQRRARLKLLLVLAVFAAPAIVAGLLVASGWQPSAQGHGQPITPQRNFEQEHVTVRLADGQRWPWRDSEPRLTLIALPGPHCAARCFQALTGIAKARVMLSRNQSRLRLLYLGEPPAGSEGQAMRQYWPSGTDVGNTFAAWRPSAPDTVSALLVESNGTALAYYPPGFDASGLLQDLRKVIK
jgi:cytochrome oxidase Cu insertion factor (SCO1/SenC/PrrC family)